MDDADRESADVLTDAIDVFVDHYCKTHPRLVTPYDPDWPSPCERGSFWLADDDTKLIEWQPSQRTLESDDFAGLEAALEFAVHPDIKTHYGRYWSNNLEARAPQGHVSLLYLWNDTDISRLTENLIGHAVACRHNKTPFSVFFACTEPDSDLYLTVNNTTGVVQVEQPGHAPLREVASCLEEFYGRLVPAACHSSESE